jgi:hypothetical protein
MPTISKNSDNYLGRSLPKPTSGPGRTPLNDPCRNCALALGRMWRCEKIPRPVQECSRLQWNGDAVGEVEVYQRPDGLADWMHTGGALASLAHSGRQIEDPGSATT